MEYWEAFQEFEFSNETLVVVGGLLVFIAALQIIKSSMKLAFWVLLAAVGGWGAIYGYDRSAVRLPDDLIDDARNLAGSGGLTDSMMQALCLKVIDEQRNSASLWFEPDKANTSLARVLYPLTAGQAQLQIIDFNIYRDINHKVEHFDHSLGL